jgi:hypothetical protein
LQTSLADLTLRNDGETDGAPRCSMEFHWDSTAVRARAEALPGWQVTVEGTTARFTPAETQRRLPPGEVRAMGWLRLEPSATLYAKIIP